MTAIDLVRPWRISAGILAVVYAGVIILALPQSRLWLVLACGIVLAASILAGWMEYPLLALWPTFCGLFLLSACAIVLMTNGPKYDVAPLTHASIEMPLAALVACGFIFWGFYTTRKMLTY